MIVPLLHIALVDAQGVDLDAPRLGFVAHPLQRPKQLAAHRHFHPVAGDAAVRQGAPVRDVDVVQARVPEQLAHLDTPIAIIVRCQYARGYILERHWYRRGIW
ncbi:hypothetical protein B0H67DRAFT_324405 [Lasiosphaeris hirsuta]|uniref:Uncharacterized protein n=1 Tax=Lasiosphaeris hirsuta TaxID=260670 RepID=A0AA40A236_9PEZI|nr:hypothetical protein B0H67DRAFT_324405 [Lasiosphaeris hirsuta]